MSPLLTLLVQIVVIVAAARAVAALFRRLGQPAVVGEMLAGLMLGPSLFGRIAPGSFGAVFPLASLDVLNLFSQFGLVLFMFLVGSRLDSALLRKHSRSVLVTSYISMLLPFALGIGLGLAVAPQFGVPAAGRLAFVLFVGLSLSVTAFPVLVRIVAEHDLTSTRLGAIAVTCAAFDDVTAWVVLAFVTSLAQHGQPSVTGPLLWLAAYGLVMLFLVRPLLRWLLRQTRDDETQLAVLLVAALSSAAVTEWLGIHALFGGFFLGALMAEDIRDRRVPAERIEPLAVALFLPIFFAFTGLRTNVYLLDSPALIAETIGILAVAVLGKAAGPLLSGQRLGFSRQETLALGVLLNARGLVELVVLSIGLEIGLLPPELFAMLTLMALATTAMTSPLLKALGYPRR